MAGSKPGGVSVRIVSRLRKAQIAVLIERSEADQRTPYPAPRRLNTPPVASDVSRGFLA